MARANVQDIRMFDLFVFTHFDAVVADIAIIKKVFFIKIHMVILLLTSHLYVAGTMSSLVPDQDALSAIEQVKYNWDTWFVEVSNGSVV